MYVRKRKRSGPFGGGGTVAVYSAPKASGGPQKKRRKTGSGYSRTGGYYGRFTASGNELKFYDVAVSDGAISASGAILASGSINNIAQDTTESTRIGRACTLTSFHMRWTVKVPYVNDAALPSNGDSVRMIIYIDKQCNGATAAVTDILETADIHSFRNLANSNRFRVLSDKITLLNYTNITSEAPGTVTCHAYSKEMTMNKTVNIPLEFNGITGALTEIRSNNVGILLISENGAASMGGIVRWRFKG